MLFTRSMFLSETDLYKAKAEYYEKKLIEIKKAWDEGWFCSGDENQIKFDQLMKEIEV